MSPSHFGDRLATAVAQRESQIVCGLDPHPDRLWRDDLSEHCRAVVEAAAPALVAVKPQLACFERFGPTGWSALAALIEHAHAHDLLVILDGKRGDVPVSATVYAEALATGDAATVNPLLGRDSLQPYLDGPAAPFLLVRTSNPGAADVLDLALAAGRSPVGAPRPSGRRARHRRQPRHQGRRRRHGRHRARNISTACVN